MKHTNKIALITGGSRGLGRNTALKLARDGADVILTYRERKDEGQAVLAEIEKLGRKAALLQLDVANTGGFDAFAKTVVETLQAKWQRNDLDFLINNAGIDVYSLIGQTTEDAFDRLLNVHFRGVYFLTQRMLPLIANSGRRQPKIYCADGRRQLSHWNLLRPYCRRTSVVLGIESQWSVWRWHCGE